MNHIVSDDSTVIIAELKRRGRDPFDGHDLPNVTIAFPGSLELFYVQQAPRLAAWARYATLDQLNECLRRLTWERLENVQRNGRIAVTVASDVGGTV